MSISKTLKGDMNVTNVCIQVCKLDIPVFYLLAGVYVLRTVRIMAKLIVRRSCGKLNKFLVTLFDNDTNDYVTVHVN